MNLERLFSILYEKAATVEGRYKVAAALLDKRGKVVAYGLNSYVKSHPAQKRWAELASVPDKIFLHAEIDALLKVRRRDPYAIALARLGKKKKLPVDPCTICSLALERRGVLVVIKDLL